MKRSLLLMVAVLVLAGPALMGQAAQGPSDSAGLAWSITSTPNPKAPNGLLNWDSCSSPVSCFAVGSFVRENGIGSTLAERWDGSAWSTLPTPNPAGASASSLAGISCRSDGCMAVGYWFDGSGNELPLAERWNGTRWGIVTVPAPAAATGITLSAVSCSSVDACTAVGGDSSGVIIERWNGTAWHIQKAPNPSQGGAALFGVSCPAAQSCTAVGDSNSGTLVERWNAARWEIHKAPEPAGSVYAFFNSVACATRSDCTAVGASLDPSYTWDTLAEVWKGSGWHVQRTPNPSDSQSAFFFGVDCSRPAACVGVGGYFDGNGDFVTLGEARIDAAWRVRHTPDPANQQSNYLGSVSCPTSSICRSVGQGNGSGTPEPLEADWDGSSWTLGTVPGPLGAAEVQLNGVFCPDATDCFAVGTAGPTFGTSSSVAERWNGDSWRLQSIPTVNGANLSAVSCVSVSFCVAAGGSDSGVLLERWNGRRWAIQTAPTPAGAQGAGLGGVSCVSASDCMASGAYFTDSGAFTLTERWDGTAWSIVPSPNPPNSGQSFLGGISCSSSSFCMATGEKHPPSGVVRALAESWDGSSWTLSPTPSPSGVGFASMPGVSCVSSTACTAVGGSDAGTLVESWNGAAWTIEDSPTPPGDWFLTGISCPLVDTCLAVGGPPNGPGGGTIAEIWDGSTWQLQATPVLPGAHTLSSPAISCWSSTACVMVGGFENDGPGSITLAEQWDGTLASAATRLASTVRGPQAPDCSRATRPDRRNLLLCGVGDPLLWEGDAAISR